MLTHDEQKRVRAAVKQIVKEALYRERLRVSGRIGPNARWIEYNKRVEELDELLKEIG